MMLHRPLSVLTYPRRTFLRPRRLSPTLTNSPRHTPDVNRAPPSLPDPRRASSTLLDTRRMSIGPRQVSPSSRRPDPLPSSTRSPSSSSPTSSSPSAPTRSPPHDQICVTRLRRHPRAIFSSHRSFHNHPSTAATTYERSWQQLMGDRREQQWPPPIPSTPPQASSVAVDISSNLLRRRHLLQQPPRLQLSLLPSIASSWRCSPSSADELLQQSPLEMRTPPPKT